ncbi:thioredoxin [Planctomycetota bacterium]
MVENAPVDVTDIEFHDEVLNSEVPVLVDYWAPWCGPCRMVSPVLDKIAAHYQGQVKVCKVNIDEQREVAIQYGVMSVPTLHLFKDGLVVDQMGGVTPSFEEDLHARIGPHLE